YELHAFFLAERSFSQSVAKINPRSIFTFNKIAGHESFLWPRCASVARLRSLSATRRGSARSHNGRFKTSRDFSTSLEMTKKAQKKQNGRAHSGARPLRIILFSALESLLEADEPEPTLDRRNRLIVAVLKVSLHKRRI